LIRPGTTTLAAAVLAFAGTAACAQVPAVQVEAGPARPVESGGRDSPATLGPMAIGAAVRDRTGAEIGHITRLTTDRQGQSIVEVRQNEDVYSIPLADLAAHDGEAVSNLDQAQLKRLGMSH
jgi:hypothetical protein